MDSEWGLGEMHVRGVRVELWDACWLESEDYAVTLPAEFRL